MTSSPLARPSEIDKYTYNRFMVGESMLQIANNTGRSLQDIEATIRRVSLWLEGKNHNAR